MNKLAYTILLFRQWLTLRQIADLVGLGAPYLSALAKGRYPGSSVEEHIVSTLTAYVESRDLWDCICERLRPAFPTPELRAARADLERIRLQRKLKEMDK